MEMLLTTLLRLSVLGSALALALMLARRLLRGRGGQAVCYYLWLVVLLRLCVPMWVTLSLPAPAAPIPAPAAASDEAESANTLLPDSQADTAPSNVQAPGSDAGPIAPTMSNAPTAPETPAETGGTVLSIVFAVWVLGAAVSIGFYILGYVSFSRRVRRDAVSASPEALAALSELSPGGQVRLLESGEVNTPLLIGPLKPTIVLPHGVTDAAQLQDILAHELTHASRRDLLFKWFAALVTSLHWFNPLMVLVRREIDRACELSCDAAVLRTLDEPGRKRYGETLLDLASDSSRGIGTLAVTLCEEKKQLKERLVAIVKYRKMNTAAVVLSALLAVILCGCAAIGGAQASPKVNDTENTGLGEAYTSSFSEVFASVELPENVTLNLASDKVDYPSQVRVFESTAMIDFASMADKICPVLLGSGYEDRGEGKYSLVTDVSTQSLSLGNSLYYRVDYADGKGNNLILDVVDYDSIGSKYDSPGAQMKGNPISDFAVGGELDGLSHETAINAVTGILEEIGFTNLSVSRWAALNAEDLQLHLDTVEEINDEFKGMQFTEEDECYLIAYEFSTDGLKALGKNENSAATQIGGVEIRCLYGREGLINLYCRFIPDTTAGSSTVDTISPEAAAKVFAEEYAQLQQTPKTLVSVDLEYVIYNSNDVLSPPSENVYVPAWVFTVEYVKTFLTPDGETLENTYHDYAAVNAATGEFLGL